MTEPSSPKVLVRNRLLAARAALPDTVRAAASRRVCQRLLKVPEVAEARILSAFSPFGTEVDIRAALEALLQRGCALLLPWVDDGDLHLAPVGDLDGDLVAGWRGVREPAPALRGAEPAGQLDVAIVPGVGFDLAGGRLGYGGGHFDRFLSRLCPGTPVVAVAFSAQVVEEIPAEAHDIAIDVLVTEDAVHRIAGRGR